MMKPRQPSARPRRKRSVERLPTSIRLTDQLATAIRDEAERTGRPIAWIGRRAQVAGTEFEVWRIVELVEEHGSAPGLSCVDIDLALAYARSFPKEIEFLRYLAGLGGTLR